MRAQRSSFDCFRIQHYISIPLIWQNGRLFLYRQRLPIVSVNQIIDLGHSGMGVARQIIDLDKHRSRKRQPNHRFGTLWHGCCSPNHRFGQHRSTFGTSSACLRDEMRPRSLGLRGKEASRVPFKSTTAYIAYAEYSRRMLCAAYFSRRGFKCQIFSLYSLIVRSEEK